MLHRALWLSQQVVAKNILAETCPASVKTLGFHKTRRSYLCALPQTRINQSDVCVTPSNHNMLDVGGGPKRCIWISIAVHDQEKAFVGDRMAGELRQVIWYSGVALTHRHSEIEGVEHSVLTDAAQCQEERRVGVHVWARGGGQGLNCGGR